MIGIMLQYAGYGFPELLADIEALGFFQYFLPFLLIFAVSYAILTKLPTFKDNSAASAIISITLGLLALQFNMVPAFFQNIFPKFGMGLAVLLIAIILGGAFMTETKDDSVYKWVIFVIGIIIFIAIIVSSLSGFNSPTYYWIKEYGAITILALGAIGAIIAVVVSQSRSLSS